MKRRSQPKQKKIGTYSKKVAAGTHPIIHHDRFRPRGSK